MPGVLFGVHPTAEADDTAVVVEGVGQPRGRHQSNIEFSTGVDEPFTERSRWIGCIRLDNQETRCAHASQLTARHGFDRMPCAKRKGTRLPGPFSVWFVFGRSEEHTSELQSREN